MAIWAYLAQPLFPAGLTPAYPHPGLGLSLASSAFAWVALLALTAVLLLAFRRHPAPFIGWTWFLLMLMLMPVLGIIQVGAQSRADRFTYLPSAGLAFAVTWLATGLAGRGRTGTLPRASAIACAAFAAMTAFQTGHWRTDLALWEHSLAVTRRNWFAEYSYGSALELAGRHQEAVRWYRSAMDPNPLSGEVRCALGNELVRAGSIDEALARLGEGLQLRASANCHNAMGVALSSAGRREEALGHFTEAVRLAPENRNYRANLERARSAASREKVRSADGGADAPAGRP